MAARQSHNLARDPITQQNVKVFVRLWPMNERELRGAPVIEAAGKTQLRVMEPGKAPKLLHYDEVFGVGSRQELVYREVAAPLVEQVLLGFNCTVFAYGQTETGKTRTLLESQPGVGTSWEEDSSVGLIPRALDHLFEELRGKEFSISVNFIEVYCEKVYDLLSENKKCLPLMAFWPTVLESGKQLSFE